MSDPERSPGSLVSSSEAGRTDRVGTGERDGAWRVPRMATSLSPPAPRICPTLRSCWPRPWPSSVGSLAPDSCRWRRRLTSCLASEGTVLVQAGTGTGKSLAYLVAAARTAVAGDEPVVIATATLALQRQLIEKDLPVVARALAESLGREPRYAVLKGRSNYLCLDRLNRGSPDPDEAALFDTPTTRLGRQAARLGAWAQTTTTGDRDDLDEPVDGRVWAGLSVSARECPGASACPSGADCFAEHARSRARSVDLVVTNHAMLAIHVEGDTPVLPDHRSGRRGRGS